MTTTNFLYRGVLPDMSDKNIITLPTKMERKSLNEDQLIKKREIDPTKNAWSYNMGASDCQIQMTCSSGVIMYTKNKNNKRRENVQMT